MPFSQIDDVLFFDEHGVKGRGTLERARGQDERMKTFWVRVCQAEHDHAHGRTVNLAEAHFHGDSPEVFKPDGTWELDLPILEGSFEEHDAAATAVLVFEAGGDLLTLAWSECVHLRSASHAGHSAGPSDHV
jgi:hypothetical protein